MSIEHSHSPDTNPHGPGHEHDSDDSNPLTVDSIETINDRIKHDNVTELLPAGWDCSPEIVTANGNWHDSLVIEHPFIDDKYRVCLNNETVETYLETPEKRVFKSRDQSLKNAVLGIVTEIRLADQ